MGKVSDSAEVWATSIRNALKNQADWARAGATLVFTGDGVSLEAVLQAIDDADFVRKTLEEFNRLHFFGPTDEWSFRRQFFQRADRRREYYPKIMGEGKGRIVSVGSSEDLEKARAISSRANRAATRGNGGRGHMYTGFMALWDAFREPVPIAQRGGVFTLGVGRRESLDALKLSDYMWVTGSKNGGRLNNLFQAVEFGTGIARNVGAGFVNHSGPTKDPSGDGSWWLGQGPGEGVRILGQRGFHFLYDEQTRRPHAGYLDFFRREFPRLFLSRVKARLQGLD